MKTFVAMGAGFCLLAIGLLLAQPEPGVEVLETLDAYEEPGEPLWLRFREEGRQPVVGLGDPELLRDQYRTWKELVVDPSHVDLFPSSLLDQEEEAGGWVRIDFDAETVSSEIYGIAEEAPLELWLVDNHADSSAVPDPDDRTLYLGCYAFENGVAVLEKSTAGMLDRELVVDSIVVTPIGMQPYEGGLFYGAPELFQRLYALERRLEAKADAKRASLLSMAFVTTQSGGVPTGFPTVFTDLVTQGEDLFFNETFKGNGRTCGTCHFAVNNFTIEPEIIAKLPRRDPLFLAEFSPPHIFGHPENLDAQGNPRRFENPELMRAFGLIVENLDGFGDLDERFTMRGVPHNIGMRVSTTRPPGSISFPNGPDERTGWSGDGSPFGTFSCGPSWTDVTSPPPTTITVKGTTRSFALGAVIQHFPRTLDRDFCGPHADFRLPNDAELDAFQAFFFALGRQNELNLTPGAPNELVLADSDASQGQLLFTNASASEAGNLITCANCHQDAGSNQNGTNSNIDTNVEEFIQNRLYDPNFTVIGEPRPVDGGFGTNPQGDFTSLVEQPGFTNENFGNGTFNLVSIVEAADTAPFFHPNSAFTVEESIEFYESTEFGGAIVFNDKETAQVAAFMRAINALDNIENLATPRAQKAIAALQLSNPNDDDVVNFLLEVAIADTRDAAEVLRLSHLHSTGGLPVNAVKQLRMAMRRFMQAQNPHPPDYVRIARINDGLAHLANAVGIIRVNP